MLFGVPIKPLDQFHGWLPTGLAVFGIGLIGLIWGLTVLSRSWARQHEWDDAILNARAERLTGELRLHSARLEQLIQLRDVAVASKNGVRADDLTREMDLEERTGELIADELRRVADLGPAPI